MWDHRQYYTLSEAYWLTGKLLFPKQWTGEEVNYRPVAGLNDLRAKRSNAFQKHERQLDHTKFLRANYPIGASQEEYLEHQNAIKTAEAETANARMEFDKYSRALAVPEESDAQFQRKSQTEARLAQAFERNELDLIYGTGQIVEWKRWSVRSSFRVVFGQSLVYAPKEESSRRRDSGFVKKTQFDDWLEKTLKFEIALINREGEDAYHKMRDWFEKWIVAQPKKPKKATAEQVFLSQFSPKGKTTPNDFWALLAPKDWRTSGRHKAED